MVLGYGKTYSCLEEGTVLVQYIKMALEKNKCPRFRSKTLYVSEEHLDGGLKLKSTLSILMILDKRKWFE